MVCEVLYAKEEGTFLCLGMPTAACGDLRPRTPERDIMETHKRSREKACR
jgi:hypothetical protein